MPPLRDEPPLRDDEPPLREEPLRDDDERELVDRDETAKGQDSGPVMNEEMDFAEA